MTIDVTEQHQMTLGIAKNYEIKEGFIHKQIVVKAEIKGMSVTERIEIDLWSCAGQQKKCCNWEVR